MIIKKYNDSFDVVETSNITFWTQHYNNWEHDTFNFLFRHLDKDKVFIDIGSWIGPISLVACKYSKKCICFEPDELAYNEFNDNIKLNNINNIELENLAISIHEEIWLGANELGTSVTRENCNENTKMYSCKNLQYIFEKYELKENLVSAIKIDVEGHESELLKDKFLWDLKIPMHISLHPGWKHDKQKYFDDIVPFFEYKGVNIFNFNVKDFFDVEIN